MHTWTVQLETRAQNLLDRIGRSIRKHCLLLLVFAAFLLPGCATPGPTVKSAKDPAYTGTLKRTLIVAWDEKVADARMGKGFTKRFLQHLDVTLTARGVVSQVFHVKESELDGFAGLDELAAKFQASEMLFLESGNISSRTETTRANINDLPDFSSRTSMSIGFRIFDRALGKVIWRMRAHYGILPRPEELAQQLEKQLAADGMF